MKRRRGICARAAAGLICGVLIALAGCGSSGVGGSGSGTGGDIVDPGSDLVNTLWVGEGEGFNGGDIVMTIRENGKGVWVEYGDWNSSERAVSTGACFTVEFLSDSEMDITVYAEFKEGSWTAPNPESQPGTMPYGVVDGVMTVGDASEPEFVVSLMDDGLTDPLRGTSWKYFDIESAGRARAIEFRSDGTMESLEFQGGDVDAQRGTYFIYGLDNATSGDETFVEVFLETRDYLEFNWTDISADPVVGGVSFLVDAESLTLLDEETVFDPTEGNGSIQGNAWLGHEVWISDPPQIMAMGTRLVPIEPLAAAALDDVLVLAHTDGSYGYSSFDQWPAEGDVLPQRNDGNCGTADFGSIVSSDFSVYAAWNSEGDPPDWVSQSESGQSLIAHLGDLFIEKIDGGTGYALQYVDIGELNPVSGTHWVGTHFDYSEGGDSVPTLDADIVFASDGTFEGIFTNEGAIEMGIRGRYFVVAPEEMVWWIDEEYNSQKDSWEILTEPNAWGIEFQVAGTELWAADYPGNNVVLADLQ